MVARGTIEGPTMRRVWTVILCATLCLGINSASADGGTQAKCSCDLDAKADDRDGALVRNGARCVLDAYEHRDWCNFLVKDLKGTASHYGSVMKFAQSVESSADDRRAVVNVLSTWFMEWQATREHISAAEGRYPLLSNRCLSD